MENYSRSDRSNDIPSKNEIYAQCATVTVTAAQETSGEVSVSLTALPNRALVFINGALNRGNYVLNAPSDGPITFDSIYEADEIVIVY